MASTPADAGGRAKEMSMQPRVLLSCCGTALALLGWACGGDGLGPVIPNELILVLGHGRAQLLDGGAQPRLLAQWDSLPQYVDAAALSPDSAIAYADGFSGSGRDNELVALDSRSLKVLWRERLSEIEQRSAAGPLVLFGGPGGSAIAPDGGRLVLRARRNDTVGLAVLDLERRQPVGFVGPFWSVSLTALPARAELPEGAVVLAGTRVKNWQSAGVLFVLDPRTLEVADSAILVPSFQGSWGGLVQALPAPDGRHVYALGADRIYKYDLVERRVVATVQRPHGLLHATLAVSPDGGTLYLTDPGDGFDILGSGTIPVFSAELQAREPVDLRYLRLAGLPPQTRYVAFSRDGALAYVTAGTHRFDGQEAHLLVVDVATATLRSVVFLGGWGAPRLFVIGG